MHSGADLGFEKGGGAGGSGASFWAYLGQLRGLFIEFGAKTGGRAPPAPPSGSAPGIGVFFKFTLQGDMIVSIIIAAHISNF